MPGQGEPALFDRLHCRADGEALPVEITMTVYHEQGKTFLHSVWRDLTGLIRTARPEDPAESHKPESSQ
ncbi:MAG: hypothetical protein U5R49_14815 [Deltaproteobacteria bacterium]|nr:hypothetical protein [Deltaproteobacteria bacterium]